MPTYTPGPWRAQADRTVHDSRGTPLLRGYAGDRNWEGNAPLVAAAPELLEILAGCVEVLEDAGARGLLGRTPPDALNRARRLLERLDRSDF